MARRRGRPTAAEAEAGGQLRLGIETAIDAQAEAHRLTRAIRRRKKKVTHNDQLRLRLFADLNRDMHAVNKRLHSIAERMESFREQVSLAA